MNNTNSAIKEAATGNARFFPDDSQWQKHVALVAAYLEAIKLYRLEKVS